MIGLSPLPTAHPSRFQPTPVRTSTRCYPRFILAMGRSLGFGSAPLNSFAQLRLAFASAPGPRPLTSPRRTTPRIIMQKARGHPTTQPKSSARLPPLVGTQFQVLFHPASAVLFTFPSRYWSTIGHRQVFSLGRRSSLLQPGFLVSRPTQDQRHAPCPTFRLRGCHPLWLSFPPRFG